MAASLSLRVYTGAGPSESAAVTGIDLISADNATSTLANRQANPITVGTASYEKWLKLKIDTSPANGVTNFKIWGHLDHRRHQLHRLHGEQQGHVGHRVLLGHERNDTVRRVPARRRCGCCAGQLDAGDDLVLI